MSSVLFYFVIRRLIIINIQCYNLQTFAGSILRVRHSSLMNVFLCLSWTRTLYYVMLCDLASLMVIDYICVIFIERRPHYDHFIVLYLELLFHVHPTLQSEIFFSTFSSNPK